MSFWVYILRCGDGSYYTGHTDNLEQRINQHNQRYFPACYTATRLPLNLVFQQAFETRVEALTSEQQIKGWSRKKKEAMIKGDWNQVAELAQNTLKRTQALRLVSELSTQGERVTSVRGELFTSVRGEPVEPHSVRSEPAKPHPVHGEPTKPHPVLGEPVEPHSVRGEPAKPHPVRGEPVEPHSAHGEPAKPHPIRSEPAKPNPVRGELVEPHSVHGEPAKPHPVRGELVEPHLLTNKIKKP